MRALGTIVLLTVLIEGGGPAFPSPSLPDEGAAKLAAYEVCRPLAVVDMGAAGAESSTECNGIVKNADNDKLPDNLAIHCLEQTSARPEAYKYVGTCVQTDGDGDKIFMTYEGSNTGKVKWIGGTGKYKDLAGSGDLGVVVAPAGAPGVSSLTLGYTVTWSKKTK